MMIREAMSVFWQTLKDTWEELYSLAIVNLVWLFASITIVLFPVTMAGVYYVTNRVAHGKTFHFSDFIDGIKKFWWRSLLWILGNAVVVFLIWNSLSFYSAMLEGLPGILLGGFFVGLLGVWLATQMYFWPFLVEQENPKMLLAWRNSAYLLLASPVYTLFIGSFTLLFIALSLALPIVLIFVGMAMVALLGNNAALALLEKFGVIEQARPGPLT